MSGERETTATIHRFARRDRFVGWLANQVMRLASRKYRTVIGGSIRYGLEAAARDAASDAIWHEAMAAGDERLRSAAAKVRGDNGSSPTPEADR
jgi:hypothetical protein